MTQAQWQWDRQSRRYGNFGNANQWTVNAGLASLARESAQNSSDARLDDAPADLTYRFIRLTGERRVAFEKAAGWGQLLLHLEAMGDAAHGAVTAGQIRAGLETVRSIEPLVLLRIADHGCKGLTGPEFPDDDISPADYGNFIKLCRLDLFSGKEKAAGGSFGLGKAVYWRFSRLQTVMFNSVVRDQDAVDGKFGNRLIGVNQGVVHRLDGAGYQGRGYFGVPDRSGDVASVWQGDDLVRRLHLNREDTRPGTSALLLGFHDPDQPQLGVGPASELVKMASELRSSIEESFWPLLARGRMAIRVEVEDDGDLLLSEEVDPADTYPELVHALRQFDRGEVDATLDEPDSVVVRDVPITISKRRTSDYHGAFTHQAKLVVTLSDQNPDSLENRVCLLRQPEMVVQTVDRTFEGRTYHALLLAGAAINPDAPSLDELRADDFLRFAEPPAHDRWVPGKGRAQTSQANLTAHYVAPWIPSLRSIETGVLDALLALFGTPPPVADKPPEAVLKYLRFLRSDSGSGGPATSQRKPEIDVIEWSVIDGRWHVTFQVKARNRSEGWQLQPRLAFVGIDGTHELVDWSHLEVVAGDASLEAGTLFLPGGDMGRTLKASIRAVSTDRLPIPAEEAAIEVIARAMGPVTAPAGRDA